jgi:hypothetical protein
MSFGFKKSRADYPLGVLAIYDNRGRTVDRYCVVFTPFAEGGRLWFPTLCMSEHPTHPQGVGVMGQQETRPTRPLGGLVIPFGRLPAECRECVEDYLRGNEIECPHCGGLGPELIAAGPHAGERCRVCVSH